MYNDVSLFIDGKLTSASAERALVVLNPATSEPIGRVAHADRADLDRALEAANEGFQVWRKISAFDRSKIMRKAADLLRERADKIAPLLTLEQGNNPLRRPRWRRLLAPM
jgi:succinate-semialdehyde dehydrogenase/glutarate-semialdehyde dehydrogenase